MSLVISKPKAKRHAVSIERDPRWTAVVNRDRAFDGAFVFAVKSTGIYCRPTCPARRAKAENVAFYATAAEAENAGFRSCLRCKPNEASRQTQHAAIITEACRAIAETDTPPTLRKLAAAAGMSAFHFHRIFKSVTGLTPKAYAAAHRTQRVRDHLRKGQNSVTTAIYNAGFNSSGRFYESSNAILGMTPTAFRKGGAKAEIKFAIGKSSLGAVLVASTDKGICSIMLGDDADALARELQIRFPKANLIGGDAEFEALVAAVVRLVEAPGPGCKLPLDIQGTAFQQRVWQALRAIPAGETASYSEIAERIGAPKAVRAVAQACAANKIAVAIPCHRVVRNDGALSGYRWGVERKRALLDKERRR